MSVPHLVARPSGWSIVIDVRPNSQLPFIQGYAHDAASSQVNISGTHIFLVMTAGLCMAGPFAWMVIKYWLFAL